MIQVFTNILGTPGSFVLDYVANPVNGGSWLQTSQEARVTCPWAVAGVFRNLRIKLSANATDTQTFTLKKNGSATALTLSITSGNSLGTVTGVDVSVAPGDTFSLLVVGAGTAQEVRSILEFEPTAARASGYATSVSDQLTHATATRYNGAIRGDAQWASSSSLNSANVCGVAGVFDGLYLRLDAAPGAGTSYAFTIYKNDVAQDGAGGTPNTVVTVANAATTGNASFSLTVAVGDLLELRCVPTGTPATVRAQYALAFTSTSAGYSHFCGRSSSLPSNSATTYNNPSFRGGTRAWDATETDDENLVGVTAFALRGLTVAMAGAPGGSASYTFSGRVNAASPAGAPSIAIVGAATAGTDTSGAMSLASGDTFSIQSVPASTPSSNAASWAFGMFISPPQLRGSFVAGETTTVTASRAAAFGLDGGTNVHDEEGKFKIFGDLEATGVATLPGLIIPAHATSHESGGADPIQLDDLAAPSDNTDLNASTSLHGLLRKLSGVSTEYLGGDGAWSTPAGSGDIQTLLDGISTTQGVVLYYNGTNWVALGTGTSGQFLQTQGAAANPQWATAASGSGVVVQVKNTQTGAVATGTTVIPVDDTIPQNTEGDEYMTLAITPTSATNTLKIEVRLFASSANATNWMTGALFQDSTADAIAVGAAFNTTATSFNPVIITHYMVAGTTSATTFKVRAGANGAGTTTFNGQSTARRFGGRLASSITISEIVP